MENAGLREEANRSSLRGRSVSRGEKADRIPSETPGEGEPIIYCKSRTERRKSGKMEVGRKKRTAEWNSQ